MQSTRRDDFNLIAIPTQAQLRRLRDLEAAGAIATSQALQDRKRAKERDEAHAALMELAHAVYRETQARILRSFDIDDEASQRDIAEIDREIERYGRERREIIERAVKLDDGTAVFLNRDGTAIYSEHGARLSDGQTVDLLKTRRPELEAGARWEAMESAGRDLAALQSERQEIQRRTQERAERRARVASGKLSQEDLEQLEHQSDETTPERVKRHRIDDRPDHGSKLSADELALATDASHAPLLSSRFNRLNSPTAPEAPEQQTITALNQRSPTSAMPCRSRSTSPCALTDRRERSLLMLAN